MSVTNDYVFGLYFGVDSETDGADFYMSVRIFDWDGRPLASLKLDRDVNSITFDEKTNLLYALNSDLEEKIFIYDLSETLKKSAKPLLRKNICTISSV